MLRTAALALIAAAAVDAAAPMPAGIVSRSSVAPLATIAAPMRLRGGCRHVGGLDRYAASSLEGQADQ